MKSLFKSPVIILANGLFPSSSTPLEILENAGTVICTDGAINKLESLGLMPHIIIGDLDSMDSNVEFKGLIVHDTNQSNTDLEKSLDWVIANNIEKLTILGATGLREDMTIANHYILFDYYDKLESNFIVKSQIEYSQIPNYSIPARNQKLTDEFVKNFKTIVSIRNLKYPINNSELNPSSKAISNQSLAEQFEVNSSGPILVFRNHFES